MVIGMPIPFPGGFDETKKRLPTIIAALMRICSKRRKKRLLRMMMRLLPRRLRWAIHSIARRPFNIGMVVNGVSVAIFEFDEEQPTEYRIGGYYTFHCMHNGELMRCEKIFFLADMVHVVFDAFAMIGHQKFILKTSDTEHLACIMDKATFLKQPGNVIFGISDYENVSLYYPFYLKGSTDGNSGDFYFSKIHAELHITDFAPPGRFDQQAPICPLPFVVGPSQKASEVFKMDKGTMFTVFDTEYFTRLVLRERAWLASQRRERDESMPPSGA